MAAGTLAPHGAPASPMALRMPSIPVALRMPSIPVALRLPSIPVALRLPSIPVALRAGSLRTGMHGGPFGQRAGTLRAGAASPAATSVCTLPAHPAEPSAGGPDHPPPR
ncbi:hypothetical protein M0638_00100 [Roseomonas sp. NAR14]|uniref:Uncharacterized protein n=1 Tax=Roseomonas acroporae TaxID=2937791 RepID=A0A9X1Y3F0_9PROT|nr:hypothetical protein [Roseomonas acroporae]MCK8782781.1 hypothetical protein [Roseomonas acroporae]